jgi:hypothetical protein
MLRLTAILAALALTSSGCVPGVFSYDTCGGTVCGDACWVCSTLEDDCGTRPPDGHCDRDGSCKETGFPHCP